MDNGLTESTLGEICSLVTDGTHDTPKRVSTGYPLIKAKEIVGGKIDFESSDQISESDHRKVIARSKPEFGDTLFAHIGASLGEAAFVNTTQEFSIKNIALFKPNPAIIDARYLYYCIIGPEFQGFAKGTKTGSAQPFLALHQLRDYRIRYHLDITFQRRIGGILSAYDELIENSQRRIQILEEMARSLYREWFVNFRFPGHEKAKFVPSVLGMIPKGWEVKTLAKIAEVNRLQINARNAPDELHYIDISSVSPGQIDNITAYPFADAPGRARRIVRHGDVLWSCVRPNRRSYALVMDPAPNTIASTGFAVLTATQVPFTFLYAATTTDDFVAYLSNNATGSAYPAVTATTFEKADLLIPPTPLLQNFGDVTVPIFEQIHVLQRQIQNLRGTRNLLLPRLLTNQK